MRALGQRREQAKIHVHGLKCFGVSALGDMGQQGAECRRFWRWQTGFAVDFSGGKQTGQQAHGGTLDIALNTGDLASGNPDLDTAWQLGAKYGSSGKKFGDYDMKIIYRVVQTEAVFDVISDSDFHDGRSNARGFKAEGSFGLAKGVKLRFAYFDTQEERGTQRDHEKFQADLKFKF